MANKQAGNNNLSKKIRQKEFANDYSINKSIISNTSSISMNDISQQNFLNESSSSEISFIENIKMNSSQITEAWALKRYKENLKAKSFLKLLELVYNQKKNNLYQKSSNILSQNNKIFDSHFINNENDFSILNIESPKFPEIKNKESGKKYKQEKLQSIEKKFVEIFQKQIKGKYFDNWVSLWIERNSNPKISLFRRHQLISKVFVGFSEKNTKKLKNKSIILFNNIRNTYQLSSIFNIWKEITISSNLILKSKIQAEKILNILMFWCKNHLWNKSSTFKEAFHNCIPFVRTKKNKLILNEFIDSLIDKKVKYYFHKFITSLLLERKNIDTSLTSRFGLNSNLNKKVEGIQNLSIINSEVRNYKYKDIGTGEDKPFEIQEKSLATQIKNYEVFRSSRMNPLSDINEASQSSSARECNKFENLIRKVFIGWKLFTIKCLERSLLFKEICYRKRKLFIFMHFKEWKRIVYIFNIIKVKHHKLILSLSLHCFVLNKERSKMNVNYNKIAYTFWSKHIFQKTVFSLKFWNTKKNNIKQKMNSIKKQQVKKLKIKIFNFLKINRNKSIKKRIVIEKAQKKHLKNLKFKVLKIFRWKLQAVNKSKEKLNMTFKNINKLIKKIYFIKLYDFIHKTKKLSINYDILKTTIVMKRKSRAFYNWLALHKKKESNKTHHFENYNKKLKEKALINWYSISKLRMKFRNRIEKLLKFYAQNLKAKTFQSLKRYYDSRKLSLNYKKLSTFFLFDNKVRKIFCYLKYSAKINKLQKLISYKISLKIAKNAFITWIHLYYKRLNEDHSKKIIINKRISKCFVKWKFSMTKTTILHKLFELKMNYLKLWYLKKWVDSSKRKYKKFINN